MLITPIFHPEKMNTEINKRNPTILEYKSIFEPRTTSNMCDAPHAIADNAIRTIPTVSTCSIMALLYMRIRERFGALKWRKLELE